MWLADTINQVLDKRSGSFLSSNIFSTLLFHGHDWLKLTIHFRSIYVGNVWPTIRVIILFTTISNKVLFDVRETKQHHKLTLSSIN